MIMTSADTCLLLHLPGRIPSWHIFPSATGLLRSYRRSMRTADRTELSFGYTPVTHVSMKFPRLDEFLISIIEFRSITFPVRGSITHCSCIRVLERHSSCEWPWKGRLAALCSNVTHEAGRRRKKKPENEKRLGPSAI